MEKIRIVKAIVRYNENGETKYLLLQKAKDAFSRDNIGKWECAGGSIEEGETSRSAAIREIKGETGLEFKIVKQLPILVMSDENYTSLCYVYLIDALSDKVRLSDEHSNYSWIKAEDVKNTPLVRYAGLLLEFFNNPEKYFN